MAGASPLALAMATTGSSREHQCEIDLCNVERADLWPAYYGRRAHGDRYIHATDPGGGRYARLARSDSHLPGERGLPGPDLSRITQCGAHGARGSTRRDHARRGHARGEWMGS